MARLHNSKFLKLYKKLFRTWNRKTKLSLLEGLAKIVFSPLIFILFQLRIFFVLSEFSYRWPSLTKVEQQFLNFFESEISQSVLRNLLKKILNKFQVFSRNMSNNIKSICSVEKQIIISKVFPARESVVTISPSKLKIMLQIMNRQIKLEIKEKINRYNSELSK